MPVIFRKGTADHPSNALLIGSGLSLTQNGDGLPEITATGGEGDLTQAAADLRYLQLAGGTLIGVLTARDLTIGSGYRLAVGGALDSSWLARVYGAVRVDTDLSVGGSITQGGTAVSLAGHTHAAGDITGMLSDSSLTANIGRLNTAQTWAAAQTFRDVSIGSAYSLFLGDQQFYREDATAFNYRSAASNVRMIYRTSDGTNRGSVFGDTSNFGLLRSDGNWGIRITATGGVLPGLWTADAYFHVNHATAETNSAQIHNTSATGYGAYISGGDTTRYALQVMSQDGTAILRAWKNSGQLFGSWDIGSDAIQNIRVRSYTNYYFQFSGGNVLDVFNGASHAHMNLQSNGVAGGTLHGPWKALTSEIFTVSSTSAYVGLRFLHNSGTQVGYVYGSATELGFLNNTSNWSLKCNQGSGLGGTLFGAWKVTGALDVDGALNVDGAAVLNSSLTVQGNYYAQGMLYARQGTSTDYLVATRTVSTSDAPVSSVGFPVGHEWVKVSAPV